MCEFTREVESDGPCAEFPGVPTALISCPCSKRPSVPVTQCSVIPFVFVLVENFAYTIFTFPLTFTFWVMTALARDSIAFGDLQSRLIRPDLPHIQHSLLS